LPFICIWLVADTAVLGVPTPIGEAFRTPEEPTTPLWTRPPAVAVVATGDEPRIDGLAG